MEAAYARGHNSLSLQVEKLAETASQTATQVKQMVDTVAALTTVTSQNTVSLDELTSAVQKLTNASAGRDARSQGSKDRKCYNCGQPGHIARHCDKTPTRKTVNAVQDGSLAGQGFKDQYESMDMYVNCLSRGVDESITGSESEAGAEAPPTCTNLAAECDLQVSETTPTRDIRSTEVGERTRPDAGEHRALLSRGREEIECTSPEYHLAEESLTQQRPAVKESTPEGAGNGHAAGDNAVAAADALAATDDTRETPLCTAGCASGCVCLTDSAQHKHDVESSRRQESGGQGSAVKAHWDTTSAEQQKTLRHPASYTTVAGTAPSANTACVDLAAAGGAGGGDVPATKMVYDEATTAEIREAEEWHAAAMAAQLKIKAQRVMAAEQQTTRPAAQSRIWHEIRPRQWSRIVATGGKMKGTAKVNKSWAPAGDSIPEEQEVSPLALKTDWMLLIKCQGVFGFTPRVTTVTSGEHSLHFLTGHMPRVLKQHTAAEVNAAAELLCKRQLKSTQTLLEPSISSPMGVVLCEVDCKPIHLTQDYESIFTRKSDGAPPRWDSKAWPDLQGRRPLLRADMQAKWDTLPGLLKQPPFKLVCKLEAHTTGFRKAMAAVVKWSQQREQRVSGRWQRLLERNVGDQRESEQARLRQAVALAREVILSLADGQRVGSRRHPVRSVRVSALSQHELHDIVLMGMILDRQGGDMKLTFSPDGLPKELQYKAARMNCGFPEARSVD